MTLRLTDDESEALRQYAKNHGQSMQEAAREAIRQLVHVERRDAMIQRIIDRDAELLALLAE
jgi:plasmid stability protein